MFSAKQFLRWGSQLVWKIFLLDHLRDSEYASGLGTMTFQRARRSSGKRRTGKRLSNDCKPESKVDNQPFHLTLKQRKKGLDFLTRSEANKRRPKKKTVFPRDGMQSFNERYPCVYMYRWFDCDK